MSLMIPAWVNGALTPVEKLEAHEKGFKHKAISVFMICNGKILIQRRALEKYHTPGLWANTCCTHPLWNEAPEDCAMRRMKEELDIENIQLIYRDRIEYRADVGNGLIEHEVVDLFITHVDAPASNGPKPRGGDGSTLGRISRSFGRGSAMAQSVYTLVADLSGSAFGSNFQPRYGSGYGLRQNCANAS